MHRKQILFNKPRQYCTHSIQSWVDYSLHWNWMQFCFADYSYILRDYEKVKQFDGDSADDELWIAIFFDQNENLQ